MWALHLARHLGHSRLSIDDVNYDDGIILQFSRCALSRSYASLRPRDLG